MLPTVALAAGETVIDVHSRPGITQRILVAAPAHPRAMVLLYAGGDGQIGIREDGKIDAPGNFLVRTRRMFLSHGIATVLLDAPGDAGEGYRTSSKVADDTKAVIERVRTAGVPIILVGTSRGTISAANAAARLGNGVDGLVLTSSVTATSRSSTETLYSTDLGHVVVPTLVVHNREDACVVCPFDGAQALARRFAAKGSAFVEVSSPGSRADACGPFSAHGFLGNEAAAIDAISEWIDRLWPKSPTSGRYMTGPVFG